MAGDVTTLVRQALDELNRGLAIRDPALANAFHRQAIFVGSEPGESATGRAAIATLLQTIYAAAHTVQFDWNDVTAAERAGVVWFEADGAVVIGDGPGEVRRAYRLAGVLTVGRKGLRWRLFHGSEPWLAPAAPAFAS